MSDKKHIFDGTINIPTLLTIVGLCFGSYKWLIEAQQATKIRVLKLEINAKHQTQVTNYELKSIKRSIERVDAKVDRLPKR